MAPNKGRTVVLVGLVLLIVFVLYRVGPKLDTNRVIKMLNPPPQKWTPSSNKNTNIPPKRGPPKQNIANNKADITVNVKNDSLKSNAYLKQKPQLPKTQEKKSLNITSIIKTTPKYSQVKSKMATNRLRVIDLQTPSQDPAHCLISKTDPQYTACIYDTKIDNTVSLHLKNSGLWEEVYIPTFQKILRSDPELGFIDIGANIGPWGLLAATMGHRTVMVEPYPSHVSKIKKATQIGKITDKVVIVENALSDVYEAYTTQLAWGDTNLGAIRMVPFDGKGVKINSVLMDDLLEITTFKRALLKIDAEGFEDKALARSDKLFQQIFIPYVLMEWAFPKYVFKQNAKRVMSLISNMLNKGYLPYEYGWKLLEIPKWRDWPLDLIWGHKLVTPIC